MCPATALPTAAGHFHRETSGAGEEVNDVPVIHCTSEELATERFWFEQLAPIAAAHGQPPPNMMTRDAGDQGQHLLLSNDGQRILAVVITDRPACSTCGR